jgi:hypothetical protein
MDGVSFGIVSFSRCYAFLFIGVPFLYCALSSGEIWNLLAAFSVYVFFAICESYCGGVISFFLLLLDAVFLCYRDV